MSPMADFPPLVFAPSEEALVDRLLARQLAQPERLQRAIDPRDEMYLHAHAQLGADRGAALADYFAQGLRVFDQVRQIVNWRFGGFSGLTSVLDFASGFGRVTRFLATELPTDRLWAAEISQAALSFQRRHLGVQTISSGPQPAELVCSRDFDLILVSSLFSHLPETAFRAWLARLVALLSPRGLLAMTVHDEALLPAGERLPERGILFIPLSESRSLDIAQYGSSWVNEAFVLQALKDVGPTLNTLRLPRGHCGFQDLYLAARPESGPLSGLDYDPGIEGYIDRLEIGPRDQLVIGGWAVEASKALAPLSVEVEIAGITRVVNDNFSIRPDLPARTTNGAPIPCAWQLTLQLPMDFDACSVQLLVTAKGARGFERVLWAGSLAGALVAHARLRADWLTQRTVALGRCLEETTARLETEAAAAARGRERIAAMESSRFWKTRNAWFAIKRAFGLTEET